MTGNAKLYKYLDVDGGIKMLHHSNLQFTNATRLNDPYDCHPALFDFSNAPEDPYNLQPKDFRVKKGKLDTENLRNRAWICSLSKVHNSLPMWNHYSKNHEGVCIGLDLDKAHKYLSRIQSGIYVGAMEMNVQYSDVIEKHDYFHDTKDTFHYQLSTKAKAWEHEHEFRLLLINPNPAFVPMVFPETNNKTSINDWREMLARPHLGSECFDSLYLGVKIDPKKRKEIIAEARKCNPEIKIYQMHIDPEVPRLKEELL